MALSNVCWGIDIGSASIKAIKLELVGEGQVKVLEHAVIQHPKVLSTPGVDANDVLRVSLGALVSQHDLSKSQISLSMPGHAGFARFAKLPPVEPRKVPDIVKFEAIQQIPFQLDQVEWDYQTFVTPDSPEIEVGIFAITKEKVLERLTMLQDFGITPNHVVLSPIAVYNALAFDLDFNNKTPGTIIVDIGTTSTDLVIATPGRVWVRTFPIGGHQFTEALVSQFQLSYPKAEKLKREAEDTRHARQVFQAMRPVFTDLAQDIQRSIGYFQSINKDAQLTRLIGLGSTFLLPGLRKYLKQQLSLDVYRIEEFKKATVEGDQAAAYKDSSLTLCTAYGLALHGLGLNAVGGNLMPVSVVRETMWKDKTKWFGMAAGFAVAASAAMFIRPIMDDMAIKSMPPETNASIKKIVADAQQLKQEADREGVSAAGEPDYTAANIVRLFERRGVYQSVVADLGRMLGDANSRARGWAQEVKSNKPTDGIGFSVVRFNTSYAGPVAQGGDPSGGFGGQQTDTNEPATVLAFPRIKCELTLTTTQPEPRRFVESTIDPWLRRNAKREGLTYEIVFVDPPFRLSERAREESQPVPPGMERPPGRRGDERMFPPNSPFREGPGGGTTPPPPGGDAVDGIAALLPTEEPPAQTATVTVTWWVTLKPAEGEQGGAAAGGGV